MYFTVIWRILYLTSLNISEKRPPMSKLVEGTKSASGQNTNIATIVKDSILLIDENNTEINTEKVGNLEKMI